MSSEEPDAGAALCLVLGPPRSGTTLVSDWIMESPGGYCVHEVLPELAPTLSAAQIVDRLRRYAASGRDRLEKPGQRAFIDWDTVCVEPNPAILGWKEPLTAAGAHERLPEPLETVLKLQQVRAIVLNRHPFDIVASGLRRAEATPNWPDYSIEALCSFWRQANVLRQRLKRCGTPLLCLQWEELALEPEQAAQALTRFTGQEIVASSGRERSRRYLADMRMGVSRERGWVTNPARNAFDLEAVTQILGDELGAEGYRL